MKELIRDDRGLESPSTIKLDVPNVFVISVIRRTRFLLARQRHCRSDLTVVLLKVPA